MSPLRISFLDVGQGDTTVIYDLDAREAVVIDCVEAQPVLDFLESQKINLIRALIITHSHADHYFGVVSLLDNISQIGVEWETIVFQWDRQFPRQYLRDPDGHSDDIDQGNEKRRKSLYEALYEWASRPENKAKNKHYLKLGREAPILNSLNFIHPEHHDMHDLSRTNSLNNTSFVIRVGVGISALLAADIEPAGWALLRKNYPDLLNSDVLKFPHHGAWRNASITEFLKEVNPKVVVISVGTSNKYDHPMQSVLDEIRGRKIRLLCTQATTKCGIKKDSRESVLALIKSQDNVRYQISEQTSGCPCAGTVTIELGAELKVISPTLKQHIGQIIKKHLPNPQCSI